MGIAEYPFDGSWGYQVTGYYAPTSRYGTSRRLPCTLMDLICMKQGIGVILRLGTGAFSKRCSMDCANFDGTCHCMNILIKERGEHPHWGTYDF